MMPPTRRALAVLASLAIVVAACEGGEDDPAVEAGTDEPADAAGEWVRHDLAPHGADRVLVGAPVGQKGVAVLSIEEAGTVHAHVVGGDGTAEEVDVAFDPPRFPILGGVTDGPAGFVAAGSDPTDGGRNFVLASPDGRSWTEVTTTGLDVPMDVVDVIAIDDRYVLAGTLRTADDPSRGGFVPTILTSTDGVAWTTADTPDISEGSVRDLAVSPTGLFAVVDDSGESQLWSSPDGATWSPVAGAPSADRVVSSGDVLVLSATTFGEGPPVVHRSTDAGSSWERVRAAAFGDDRGLLWVGGDDEGFLAIATPLRTDPFRDDPSRCYADIERCRPQRSEQTTEVLLTSEDGLDWAATDLRGLDGLFRPGSAVRTAAGDTVVLGAAEGGTWGAWTWAADQGPLPPAPPTHDEPEPTYEGPALVDFDGSLEVGETRAFPLYIHCGFELLAQFNGVLWLLAEAPGGAPSAGAGEPIPAGWPAAGQTIFGFVTRIDEDTIEYTTDADGEDVIATYVSDTEADLANHLCA